MKYLYKKIKNMKQLFKIDESEKRRILEMHENAIRKNYLNEQNPPQTDPVQGRQPYSYNGITYKLPAIDSDANLNMFTSYGIDGLKTGNEAGYHLSIYSQKLRDKIAQDTTDNRAICNKSIVITGQQRKYAFDEYKKTMENLDFSPAERIYGQPTPSNSSIASFAASKYKDNYDAAYKRLETDNITWMSDAMKKIPNACQA
jgi:hypothetical protein